MAYTNNRYQQNSYGKNRNDSHAPKIEARPLPSDYVDHAEVVMSEHYKKVTTSKLRNILSLFMDVYNTEILRNDAKLTDEDVANIQMARIRVAYECGRDLNTREFREFVEEADLLPYLKNIGDSREKAIQYIRYLEALVAYHRFFGGREN